MQSYSVRETYHVVLKTLRGTDKDFWQSEFNQTSLILANTAGISPEVERNTLDASIERLPGHLLSDTRAGFVQKRYIARHLFIDKPGVRAFGERIEVMSSYLTSPLLRMEFVRSYLRIYINMSYYNMMLSPSASV
jgi:hypothetical protein